MHFTSRLAALLLALTGCSAGTDHVRTSSARPDPTAPPCAEREYGPGRATTVDELKRASRSVVLATASSDQSVVARSDLADATVTAMSLERVLRGASPSATFRLVQEGSAKQCYADGEDPVRPGSTYLLFLTPELTASAEPTGALSPVQDLGVFAVTSSEYVNLVRRSPLPARLDKAATDERMQAP